MSSQTTLVSKQVQLHQWAQQIRDCNNRPQGMPVSEWCSQNGITKACYYYRLKRVRKACLDSIAPVNDPVTFVELPVPSGPDHSLSPSAVIRYGESFSIELMDHASGSLIRNLIGAMLHAE